MSPENRIEITIGGQVFRLRCPEGEEERLRAAAQMVEAKIVELTKSTTMVDSLRVNAMAAFHFAYELLSRDEKNFERSTEYKKIQKRLRSLVEEIDSNLSEP
jgi:cell division protein ZapA